MKRFHFYEADTGGGLGGSLLDAAPAAPAAAPAAGQSTPWIADDGKFGEKWMEKLPEELRGEGSLKVMGSFTDLAKSYVATKKMVGAKLEAPGEGATPEQVASWRKTLGAPDKIEGYYADGVKTLRPDSVPEGIWDAEGEKAFLAIAHKHHLPPAAVKDILGYYGDSIGKSIGQSEEQGKAALAAETGVLRKSWGDQFDANVALASRVAQTVGLEKTHPMFQSAEVVEAFAKFGKLLSEDKLVKGDTTGVLGMAQDRVRDIQDLKSTSVPAREYRGEFGPERQAAIQKQLHELMAVK